MLIKYQVPGNIVWVSLMLMDYYFYQHSSQTFTKYQVSPAVQTPYLLKVNKRSNLARKIQFQIFAFLGLKSKTDLTGSHPIFSSSTGVECWSTEDKHGLGTREWDAAVLGDQHRGCGWSTGSIFSCQMLPVYIEYTERGRTEKGLVEGRIHTMTLAGPQRGCFLLPRPWMKCQG